MNTAGWKKNEVKQSVARENRLYTTPNEKHAFYELPTINNVALQLKVQQGFIVSRFLETTKPCIVISYYK